MWIWKTARKVKCECVVVSASKGLVSAAILLADPVCRDEYHKQGKKVICYISAGTWEPKRCVSSAPGLTWTDLTPSPVEITRHLIPHVTVVQAWLPTPMVFVPV
jgi:hypothetical protein